MWNALQTHAAKHALTYLIAFLLGLAASLGAIYDNFYNIPRDNMADLGWWQLMALSAKCIAPFATTVVAYLIKSPIGETNGATQPPPPATPSGQFEKIVPLLLIACLLFTGCAHVPPTGAKEVRVRFGVQGVFMVEKNITNIDVTTAKIRVGDTETKVGVALFSWDSSAKGVVLTNPKDRQ